MVWGLCGKVSLAVFLWWLGVCGVGWLVVLVVRSFLSLPGLPLVCGASVLGGGVGELPELVWGVCGVGESECEVELGLRVVAVCVESFVVCVVGGSSDDIA